MGFMKVDEAKCKRDGICVEECPRRVIELEGGDGFPNVAPENEYYCMMCGHCVAVCPHGAMSLAKMPIETCPEIQKDLLPSWEQTRHFLRSRRSIRVYKDEEVNRQTIQQLIETARYAPTASNSQTIHWTVITGRERLSEFSKMVIDWMRGVIAAQPQPPMAAYFTPVVARWDSGYDGILRNAPNLIIASAPKEASNGLVDCAIALTYLELAALAMGLGTCWVGFLQAAMLNTPALVKKIGLPEGHTAHYPMMIGYPKLKYYRLPERNQPPIHWK
jgi:nitroreductase/NAD-dependent dihydropyrimidine dehydrogenase PreA subunit